MNRQRVVVLGAGGFIGRRIVAALKASDWATPIAAVRRRRAAAASAGVEEVEVDATNAASLLAALTDVDGIVNSIAGDSATLLANAHALATVLPQLTRRPRTVFLSSMAVYGSATGTIGEDAPLTGGLDDYSSAKAAAEGVLSTVTNRVFLRPGIVYGPDSVLWSGLLGDLLKAGRLGQLGAAGQGCCNLVHVDDVADAALLALRAPDAAGRSFNLAVEDAPTWNSYFERYAEALGVSPVASISSWRLGFELMVAGPLLKIGEIVLGAGRLPPPIRPWLSRLCRHDIRLDVRRAASELGLQQRPLSAGLADAARWHAAGSKRNAASR